MAIPDWLGLPGKFAREILTLKYVSVFAWNIYCITLGSNKGLYKLFILERR